MKENKLLDHILEAIYIQQNHPDVCEMFRRYPFMAGILRDFPTVPGDIIGKLLNAIAKGVESNPFTNAEKLNKIEEALRFDLSGLEKYLYPNVNKQKKVVCVE